MKYNQLKVGSHKSPKRLGRGIASGHGKTAGRGTKGQMARTGASRRPGFEGGQNPLMQRLPKLHGFRSLQTPTLNVYTAQLEQFGGKVVDSQILAEQGLVASAYAPIKLISRGKLTKKLIVKLPAASKSAIKAIESAGGSFELTPRLAHPAKPEKSTKSNS